MGYKSTSDGLQYRNRESVLLASLERTETISTPSQINADSRAVNVVFDVTAIEQPPPPADGDPEPTPNDSDVTLSIEAYDVASETWYTLLTGATVTSVGTTVYSVGPGLTAVSNVVANAYLPQTWRVTVTHGDTVGVTYSVGAVLLG